MPEQPTPEAVEAVARFSARRHPMDDLPLEFRDAYREEAADLLAFIRGAIHRDGDDADAIREALGLSWAPLMGGRILSGEWQEIQPVMPGDERDEVGSPDDGRGQAKPVTFVKLRPDLTVDCDHWGHEPGEWKWSCCACSGLPNGCDNCTEYGPEFDEEEP